METATYERSLVAELNKALPRSKGPFRIQIVTGPRQVGKTTAALSVALGRRDAKEKATAR